MYIYIYIYTVYILNISLYSFLFWFLLEYIYIYIHEFHAAGTCGTGRSSHACIHARKKAYYYPYIYIYSIYTHACIHASMQGSIYSMAHVQHSCCLCKLSQPLQLHGRDSGSKLRRFRPLHPPLCSWRLSPWCPWLMWHGWLHSSRVAWVLLLRKRSASTGTADRTDEASGSCSEEPKGPTSPETSASCA